ncbi:MAG: TolC family protein [Synechococcaceae cyanobacterium]|nr:TolC family protein [Synechococcaceae cyanobacterium]
MGLLLAPPSLAGPGRRSAPYDTLLTELERILQDLNNFDAIVAAPSDAAQAIGAELRLPAPAPRTIPQGSAALAVRERVRLSLPQALALAVRNSPAVAQSVAKVQRERATLRAAWGRYAPTLSLSLGALGAQRLERNEALIGNSAIYPSSSPFRVDSGSWKRGLYNSGGALLTLSEQYVLLDFSRGPALAGAQDRLDASRQSYADNLRQLQLSISESYYAIQLLELRKRIRMAEVFNNEAVREQASALHRSGIVPRVDVLRAEAALQQSRYQLAQEEANLLSNQRGLSNLVNVPFDVTLMATDSVQLQPSWPLDLPQTLAAGFANNPQLRAIEAARFALLRQADAQAAALLPSLSVYVSAQLGQTTLADTDRRTTGCCGAAVIPELRTGTVGWAAGLQLNWTLMDGGVSRGLADASRAEALSTSEKQAQERNAIRQRLEQAFFQHQASLIQVIAARASLKAAREAFRDMRARYQLGLSDYTDVSDAIVSLTQAMEEKATAITTANISYARMLRDLLPVPDAPEQEVVLPITLPQSHSQTAQPLPDPRGS